MVKVKPLYLDSNGNILSAQPGDTLDLPVIADETEYVTLLIAADINTCCAIVDEAATPINSVNLPNINYRTKPFVDCVILEKGGPGDRVRAAITNGRVYSTSIPIAYTNNDIIYLGRDSKLTTVPPSLLNGDNWQVIVGRLVNLTEFIFDSETPIDLNAINPDGEVPSPTGHAGQWLTNNGVIPNWAPIHQSDILPDFAITSFICSVTSLEVGQFLNNPTFTFSCNESLSHLEIIENYTNIPVTVDPPTSPFSYNLYYTKATPGTLAFTLTATNVAGNTDMHTASVSWLNKIYHGSATKYVSGALDQFILSLPQSNLASARQTTFTSTPGSGENIYFAIPTSFGVPGFYVGGFLGGLKLLSSIDVTNIYGITINYQIWESDHSNLGETIITVV